MIALENLSEGEAKRMSEKNTARREVVVCEDKEALSRDAAHRFIFLANQKAHANGLFNVALAGGSTPEMLWTWALS